MLPPLDMNNEIISQSRAGGSQGTAPYFLSMNNFQFPHKPQSLLPHIYLQASIDFSSTPGTDTSID